MSDALERGKRALRKHILENKEQVIKDLEEMRKESNQGKYKSLKEYTKECRGENPFTSKDSRIKSRYFIPVAEVSEICSDLNSLLKDHFQREGAIELLIDKYKGQISTAAIAYTHDRCIEVNATNNCYRTIIAELEKIIKA